MEIIIGDVDRELESLETVFCTNGAAVEGIADRNGNIRKELGEGKRWQFGRCMKQR